MKTLWAVVAIVVLGLVGCMPVASPVIGGIYTKASYGAMATSHSEAPKVGKACAQSILGLVATGDASIEAAKKAGGITDVAYVDHTASNILGIVGEWCTIVRGK